MKPFPYDVFYAVFIKEIKSVFSQFINHSRDKNPYIFTISASEYIGNNHPTSYFISASGNTIVDFESDGHSYTSEDDLYYKYYSEEWGDQSFMVKHLPESDSMILNYMVEIENEDPDDDNMFTNFRADLFDFIIKCLKQLRNEKFFDSIYQEKILINFEVREYFDEDEMIRIFETLNTKEEARLFAKWL